MRPTLFFGVVALAAIIPMKLLESDFVTQDGKRFTIMDLELPRSTQEITLLINDLSPQVLTAVKCNIYLDFGFMVGIFGWIAALCWPGNSGTSESRSKQLYGYFLESLAFAQILAIGFDFTEDCIMLSWTSTSESPYFPSWFKPMVYAKFTIAIIGLVVGLADWGISKLLHKECKNTFTA